jgi:hypothetical protein
MDSYYKYEYILFVTIKNESTAIIIPFDVRSIV